MEDKIMHICNRPSDAHVCKEQIQRELPFIIKCQQRDSARTFKKEMD
jgi:hypothetical protein